MSATTKPPPESPLRDLYFLGDPTLWVAWPFLPLVRRRRPGEMECGLMFDAGRALGLTGYRCTVWLTNLFTLPPTLEEFLSLPREVMDTLDQVVEAGWRVD